MSTEDDGSLSQHQKLLPLSVTTKTSANPHVSSSRGISHDSSDPTFPLNPPRSSKASTCKASHPGINPDKCYSWLRPQIDDVTAPRRPRRRSESVSSSSSSSILMPAPPDGGWGWFVVAGAFTVSLICDGLAYCFGVLYSELLEHFQESRSKTSLVGSIFFSVSMIMGPMASALTTRFGCRAMTIFGGLLSSFGFLLSHFANSIDMLCFTFSVVVGIGFSFCYITSVVIVSFYFEKRRALATGLAVCGTGVGTFTFAPLMDFLIVEYGWRGLFLIMAGISLNLIVCGMLFRPLHFTERERWQMQLDEFNKIPFSREDIEMNRSRFPSESTDLDSDDTDYEEDPKTLSVPSLPTFVTGKILGPPSALLMEALKHSNNPHLTLQRYMKNAMFQLEQEQSKIEDRPGSPVDNETYTITIDSDGLVQSTENIRTKTEDLVDSLPSSLLDDSVLKLGQSPKLTVGKRNMTDNDLNHNPKVSDKHVKNSPTKAVPKSKDVTSSKVVGERSHTKDAGAGRENLDQPKRKHSGVEQRALISPVKGHLEDELTQKLQEFSPKSNYPSDKVCHKKSSNQMSMVHLGRHSALSIHVPLYRNDIFYRHHSRRSNAQDQCALGTSCPELYEPLPEKTERSYLCRLLITFFGEVSDILKSMIDFSLFCLPFFVIFSISNFLFYFWSDVPYMYAADHAVDNGIDPRKASFLLSIIGIFNTIGQVIFGCIGDMKINLINVYASISILAGVAVAFVPFMETYATMCILYGLFGFFVSVSFPLTTVLLVNFMGVSKLTSAYGVLMLMQGIANLFGPPFAGWVSDETGNYNATFYLSGVFYALSGLVLLLLYIPKFKEYARASRESLDLTIVVEKPGEDSSV